MCGAERAKKVPCRSQSQSMRTPACPHQSAKLHEARHLIQVRLKGALILLFRVRAVAFYMSMCDVILIVQIPVHLYMHFFALLSVAVRVVGVCLRLHAQIMRINGDSLTTSWPLPYFLELPPKGNYLDMRRDIVVQERYRCAKLLMSIRCLLHCFRRLSAEFLCDFCPGPIA